MPRAIDFHVHLPTTEFMQVTLGPYAAAAERFFRTEVMPRPPSASSVPRSS